MTTGELTEAAQPAAAEPARTSWRTRPWVGPTVAGLVVTLAYVQLVLRDWYYFAVNGYDTGIMSQVVQAYARFQLPHSTIKGFPNIFADHFSPVMALFAPLWWVWPDPRVLLLAQCVLLGVGAAGIYVVARRTLGVALAIAAVALFATWQGTQAGGGFDVHEVAFYVPLTVWAIERALAGKWTTAWILAGCMLLVREDGGLLLASFAVWAFIRGRRKDAAVGLTIGLSATLLVSALLKHLDAGIGFAGYFPLQNLGPTPLSALQHIATHPVQTLHALVSPQVKLETIFATLRPFLYLPALSSLVVMWLPQLLLRLLGGRAVLWSVTFHYSLPIAGLLALGYIDGIARVQGWMRRGKTAAQSARRLQFFEFFLVTMAAVTLAFNLSSGQLVQGTHSNMLEQYASSCRAVIAAVPKGAAVAASNPTAAYLVAQHQVRLWRGGARPGEYIITGPPGDDGHLRKQYLPAVKRIKATAVPIVTGKGCQLFHYTGALPLSELISISDIQPDPTGKTAG